MQHCRRGAVVIAAAALSFCPSRADAAWTQLETPNFVVIGNAPEGRLRDAAERLEVLRSVLAALLPPTKAHPPRTLVLAFNSDRSFAPYRPLFQGKAVEVAGYFVRTGDGAYIALGDATSEQAFRTVYHEFSQEDAPVSNAFRYCCSCPRVCRGNETAEPRGRRPTASRARRHPACVRRRVRSTARDS